MMSEYDTNPGLKNKPRIFYGYILVAAAFLIILLTYGSRLSFGVFFKPMASELQWSRALLSGAMTIAILVQGLWGILMGRVNDRFGPRLIMTMCCFFMGTGFILTSLVNSIWQLYLVFGVITGIGMGGVFVALISTVTRWFVKRRGTMTGVVMMGIGLGVLIVSPASNWLISLFQWRTSYIIVGGVVLAAGILAAQLLRRDPASMGLLPYGGEKAKEREPAAVASGLSLKQAVGTGQFWLAAVIFLCLGYCIFAINVHLVPHITDLEISAAAAANIMGATGALQTVGGVVLGGAADKIGNRQVLVISFILVTASMFCLVFLQGVSWFYLFAVIYGLGVGGGTVMESTIVAELFGMKSHGVILGFMSFAFTVGGAVGPLVTGYIFDTGSSYRPAFLCCAAIGILGLILGLWAMRVKPSLLPAPHGSATARN